MTVPSIKILGSVHLGRHLYGSKRRALHRSNEICILAHPEDHAFHSYSFRIIRLLVPDPLLRVSQLLLARSRHPKMIEHGL